jgi:hypothetical protein
MEPSATERELAVRAQGQGLLEMHWEGIWPSKDAGMREKYSVAPSLVIYGPQAFPEL